MRTKIIFGLTMIMLLCLFMSPLAWPLTRLDVVIYCSTQVYAHYESGRDSVTAEMNVWNEGYSYNNDDPYNCSYHSDYGWELPRGTLFSWYGTSFKYGGCDDWGKIQEAVYNGAGIGSHWCHWVNHGCSGLDCPHFSVGMQCSALWSFAIQEGCLTTAQVVTKADPVDWGSLRQGDALIRQWHDDEPGHTIVFDCWEQYLDTFWGYEISCSEGAHYILFKAEELFNQGFEPWVAKSLRDDPGSRIEEFVLVSQEGDLVFRLQTIVERNTESYQIVWSADGEGPWIPVTDPQHSAGSYTSGAVYTFTVSGVSSGYFRTQEIEVGGRPICYDTIYVP